MTKEEWDAICKQCGLCCHHKVLIEGKYYIVETHCQHLDTKTRRCKIYPERRKVPTCRQLHPMTIDNCFDWLPESCGYKERLKNGRK